MDIAITIGKLDRRILFQNPVIEKQTNGEELNSWSTHAYRWAMFEPGVVNEIIESDMQNVYTRANFVVRYDSALNEKMRIYFDGKIYNIIGINEIGRRAYQRIEAESRQIANAIVVDSSEITVDSTLILADQEWQ